MARLRLLGLLGLLLLSACRTELLDPSFSSDQVADAAVRDLSPIDHGDGELPAPDLGDATDAGCRPGNPEGFCPGTKACCPFSCWGGDDVTGWCAPGPGCPVC